MQSTLFSSLFSLLLIPPTRSSTTLLTRTCDSSHYRPFLKFLPTFDSVQGCHHITGVDTFLLKVMHSFTSQLELLIQRLLQYGMLTTSMVLSIPI